MVQTNFEVLAGTDRILCTTKNFLFGNSEPNFSRPCLLGLKCFLLELYPFVVNVIQDESKLLEMPICYHTISLVQNEGVNHGESVEQIRIHVIVHQFPKTTRCGYDDRGLIRQQPLLLLNRHSTDESARLYLVLVVERNDSLDHVVDLHGKLSGWRNNQAFYGIEDPLLKLWCILQITF